MITVVTIAEGGNTTSRDGHDLVRALASALDSHKLFLADQCDVLAKVVVLLSLGCDSLDDCTQRFCNAAREYVAAGAL